MLILISQYPDLPIEAAMVITVVLDIVRTASKLLAGEG